MKKETTQNQEQKTEQTKNRYRHQNQAKRKTLAIKKKPWASCTLLRGWRLKTAEYHRFIGSVNSPPGFRPDIGELRAWRMWVGYGKGSEISPLPGVREVGQPEKRGLSEDHGGGKEGRVSAVA